MDKETRNALRNTVTQCRRILEEAIGERLEGQYGIHANGKIEADAHMGHLSRQDADYRGNCWCMWGIGRLYGEGGGSPTGAGGGFYPSQPAGGL